MGFLFLPFFFVFLIPMQVWAQNQVDLSSQFQSKITHQYGGTCHIFSAVELLESYCFRKTGKHVQLSRDFYVYQHLRHELETTRSYTPDPHFLENELFDGFTDGGDPRLTLERFAHGLAVPQRFFSISVFQERLLQLKKTIVQEKLSVKALPALLDQDLGTFFQNPSLDPDLESCLRFPLQIKDEDFTLARAQELLSATVPFICKASHWKFKSGKSGPHAVVISGFRRASGELEFEARDTLHPEGDPWGNHLIETEDENTCDQGILFIQ